MRAGAEVSKIREDIALVEAIIGVLNIAFNEMVDNDNRIPDAGTDYVSQWNRHRGDDPSRSIDDLVHRAFEKYLKG